MKTLRTGLPDEYVEWIKIAKATDTNIDKQIKRLYDILMAYDYPSRNAHNIIIEDCKKIWGLENVIKNLPD